MIRTEQIRELIAAGESFWVGTENERKLAKTLGGRAYITKSDGRGGFKVCKLPEVQPGGKGRNAR